MLDGDFVRAVKITEIIKVYLHLEPSPTLIMQFLSMALKHWRVEDILDEDAVPIGQVIKAEDWVLTRKFLL